MSLNLSNPFPMNKKVKLVLTIFSGLIALVLLGKLLTIAFVEPWIEKKIETALQEKYPEYQMEIDKVHILFFSLGIELEKIRIRPKKELGNGRDLIGELASVKLLQLNISKLLSDNDIILQELLISEGTLRGEIPAPKEKEKEVPVVSSINIHIGKILLSKIELDLKANASRQTYSLKDGQLKIADFKIKKSDTLSSDLIKEFEFEAQKIQTVTDDRLYTITVSGLNYSQKNQKLSAKDLIVLPNYPDYEFTSKVKYQTDCIRATLNNISLFDFSLLEYLNQGNFRSSYVELEQLDMHVFRDRRKEFHHVRKPMFQELFYDFKGILDIDSLGLLKGNVTYTEHVDMASHPGKVSFTSMKASLYKISNDSFYRKKEGFFELKGQALFMGKSKMTVSLKALLFDPNHTFYLTGALTAMDAKEINPMSETNAFIYVTAGEIDAIHFSLRADKNKANGKMTLLYHGLDVAVKTKKSNDTTAIASKVISLVANKKIEDANPTPGEPVREGIIDYERDPEKFLFNYCFKSILTGMKSTLYKSPKEKKRRRELRDLSRKED